LQIGSGQGTIPFMLFPEETIRRTILAAFKPSNMHRYPKRGSSFLCSAHFSIHGE